MDQDWIGEEMDCKVCGELCRECGSALWKTAYKCDDCGVIYYDRSEFNPEYTMSGVRLGRNDRFNR